MSNTTAVENDFNNLSSKEKVNVLSRLFKSLTEGEKYKFLFSSTEFDEESSSSYDYASFTITVATSDEDDRSYSLEFLTYCSLIVRRAR